MITHHPHQRLNIRFNGIKISQRQQTYDQTKEELKGLLLVISWRCQTSMPLSYAGKRSWEGALSYPKCPKNTDIAKI